MRVRKVTRDDLQYWGILAVVYGVLPSVAAWIAWKIYVGTQTGSIDIGKYQTKVVFLAETPVRFWLAVGFHGIVVLGLLGTVIYYAREFKHGPWRHRRRTF